MSGYVGAMCFLESGEISCTIWKDTLCFCFASFFNRITSTTTLSNLCAAPFVTMVSYVPKLLLGINVNILKVVGSLLQFSRHVARNHLVFFDKKLFTNSPPWLGSK